MMVIQLYHIWDAHSKEDWWKHVNFMNRNGGFGGGSKSCPTNMGVQATNMGCVINKKMVMPSMKHAGTMDMV